jgi:hypothetical protein
MNFLDILPTQLLPFELAAAMRCSPILKQPGLYDFFISHRIAANTFKSYDPVWTALATVSYSLGHCFLYSFLHKSDEILTAFILKYCNISSFMNKIKAVLAVVLDSFNREAVNNILIKRVNISFRSGKSAKYDADTFLDPNSVFRFLALSAHSRDLDTLRGRAIVLFKMDSSKRQSCLANLVVVGITQGGIT